MKRMKVMMCVIAMMSFSALATPMIYAQDVAIVENATDSGTWTNILEWRYKVIGENLYKRLFNRSTGEWESDWILVA